MSFFSVFTQNFGHIPNIRTAAAFQSTLDLETILITINDGWYRLLRPYTFSFEGELPDIELHAKYNNKILGERDFQ